MGNPVTKSDHRYTCGEYRTWDDEGRREIIDGVAWDMSAAPNTGHQLISGEIFSRLAPLLRHHTCKVIAAPLIRPRSVSGSLMDHGFPGKLAPRPPN